MKKVIILASGSGTNAQNIIEYFSSNNNITISLVISNNRNAGVFNRISKFKIPSFWLNREAFDNKYLNILFSQEKPDLIVLAGFLWKIPNSLIKEFRNKIINIHPALLPLYGGKGMYGKNIHEIVKKNGDKFTGITIHYVNEEYDKGLILFQEKTSIDSLDSVDDIVVKIQILEHFHYPRIIEKLL
tara:strand:+ start:128 stop:685 length:558 start_codon:yes stop_codon:yes gene_type:complete